MTDRQVFDLVIKRGTVIDGLQTPRYRADIGDQRTAGSSKFRAISTRIAPNR